MALWTFQTVTGSKDEVAVMVALPGEQGALRMELLWILPHLLALTATAEKPKSHKGLGACPPGIWGGQAPLATRLEKSRFQRDREGGGKGQGMRHAHGWVKATRKLVWDSWVAPRLKNFTWSEFLTMETCLQEKDDWEGNRRGVGYACKRDTEQSRLLATKLSQVSNCGCNKSPQT